MMSGVRFFRSASGGLGQRRGRIPNEASTAEAMSSCLDASVLVEASNRSESPSPVAEQISERLEI